MATPPKTSAVILLLFILSAGCSGEEPTAHDGPADRWEPVSTPPLDTVLPEENMVPARWSGLTAIPPSGAIFHKTVTPMEAYQLLDADPDIVLIDLRTFDEVAGEVLPGVDLYLDFEDPGFRPGLDFMEREKTYMVYCQVGDRSRTAMQNMADMDFQRVYEIEGGLEEWKDAGLPVER